MTGRRVAQFQVRARIPRFGEGVERRRVAQENGRTTGRVPEPADRAQGQRRTTLAGERHETEVMHRLQQRKSGQPTCDRCRAAHEDEGDGPKSHERHEQRNIGDADLAQRAPHRVWWRRDIDGVTGPKRWWGRESAAGGGAGIHLRPTAAGDSLRRRPSPPAPAAARARPTGRPRWCRVRARWGL